MEKDNEQDCRIGSIEMKDSPLVTVGDIMTERLITINAIDTAQEAANKMIQEKVSSLAVINDDGSAAGIVTERDFVRRICAIGKNSAEVKIVEMLSAPVKTVGATAPIDEAADVMVKNRIRHLLVVEGSQANRPVGIVSATDIVSSLKENSAAMKQADKEVIKALESEGRFYF